MESLRACSGKREIFRHENQRFVNIPPPMPVKATQIKFRDIQAWAILAKRESEFPRY
jgi:hypothetical protein